MLTSKIDGVSKTLLLPFHDCTVEDYAQFYPIAEKSRAPLQKLQDNEDRGLYCVDSGIGDLNVFGKSPGDFQFVEILFIPCNVLVDDSYGFKDSVSSECIEDLDAQRAYVGPINILFYFNNERFD